jgi:hypothetical protein
LWCRSVDGAGFIVQARRTTEPDFSPLILTVFNIYHNWKIYGTNYLPQTFGKHQLTLVILGIEFDELAAAKPQIFNPLTGRHIVTKRCG